MTATIEYFESLGFVFTQPEFGTLNGFEINLDSFPETMYINSEIAFEIHDIDLFKHFIETIIKK